MRNRLAAFGIAASLPVVLLSSVPGGAAASPAARAVAYLLSIQQPDGSIDPGVVVPGSKQSVTAFTVMGAAATGRDPGSLRSPAGATALDYLARHSAAIAPSERDAAAGPTAEVILAVVAAGADPRHLGRARVDLVRRLEVQDKHNHIYGSGDTRAQALGLLAEVASATPVDTSAVDHLRSMQDADGSWNQAGITAASGDTDSTAIAVMALQAASHAVPRSAEVLAYLHLQQNTDGGFPRSRTAPHGDTNSNPDSDGTVIQALVALQQDPRSLEWTQPGGRSPISNLLTFQNESGGFHFGAGSPTPAPEGATTAPLPAALSLRPLPILALHRAVTTTSRRSGGARPRGDVTRPATAAQGASVAARGSATPVVTSAPTASSASPDSSAPSATSAPVGGATPPVAVTIPVASPAPIVGGVQGISGGSAGAGGQRQGVGPPPWPGLALAGAAALALLLLLGLRFRERRTTT